MQKSLVASIKQQFRQYEGGRIVLTVRHQTAFIEIDHAEKKNGMSGSMMAQLHDATLQLQSSDCKSLVLHGSNQTFCSGGFLPTVKQICNPNDGFRMATLMHDAVLRLRSLPLVSVSLICGNAIGGGAELALATDFRLMSPTAQMKFVEAKMGVGTGWGGGTLLQRLVGRRKALELLLTCRAVGLEEGRRIGLVDGMVEIGREIEGAVEWVDKLVAQHDLSIVKCVKGIVDCDDFNRECEIFAETWGGEVHKRKLDGNIKHR